MKQILKGGAIVYLCVLALTVPNENAIQLTATVVCHANRWARAISRMCRSSDRMIELNRTHAHLSPVGETDFKGWRGPCAVIGSGLSGGASLVAMVQTADLRQRYDSSHFPGLNQARFGRVLSQREMGSRSVIVSKIGSKNTTQ